MGGSWGYVGAISVIVLTGIFELSIGGFLFVQFFRNRKPGRLSLLNAFILIGTDQNEIWLDVENNLVTAIRINQELLNTGPVSVPDRAIGIWLKTFGDPAEVRFDRVQIFEDRSQ